MKLSERTTRYFRKFMFEPSHPRCWNIPVTSKIFIADKNNNFPSPRIYCCFLTIEVVLLPRFQFFSVNFPFINPCARLCCWRITTNENMDFINRKQSRVTKKLWNEDIQPGGDESCPVLCAVNSFMLGTCSGSSGFAYFPSRVSFIHSKGQNTNKKSENKENWKLDKPQTNYAPSL